MSAEPIWQRVFGVRNDEVAEAEACEVPEGWIVREGCMRYFVEREKLSTSRADAEARLRKLVLARAPS
jgi:fructosamine-3-kinase